MRRELSPTFPERPQVRALLLQPTLHTQGSHLTHGGIAGARTRAPAASAPQQDFCSRKSQEPKASPPKWQRLLARCLALLLCWGSNWSKVK